MTAPRAPRVVGGLGCSPPSLLLHHGRTRVRLPCKRPCGAFLTRRGRISQPSFGLCLVITRVFTQAERGGQGSEKASGSVQEGDWGNNLLNQGAVNRVVWRPFFRKSLRTDCPLHRLHVDGQLDLTL